MRRPSPFAVLAAAVAITAAWVLLVVLPRRYGPAAVSTTPASPAPAQQEPARRITATVFYISEDGMRLVGVNREVPYGATPAEQARHIIEEALEPAPTPHASAIPEGTTLRSVFVTPQGQAYVDLSREIGTRHTGGSLDELFTVYAIVNALTVNLPAVSAVQILVEGQEVDTLAGHVDLRRPLARSQKWTEP